MEPPAIIVENLTAAYGPASHPHRVIDCASFSVGRGEIAAIVGPNGVGKTTVFGVLTGGIRPTGGSVRILGLPPGEAKVGIVWQQTYASLFPWLSAVDNAAMPLRFQGVPRAERRKMVRSLCSDLGLSLPLDRRPYELSGGEQQKLTMLRALVHKPDVLLMDEPLANIAHDSAIELLDHIQTAHARTSITTLLISHQLEHTVFISDTIVPFRHRPVSIEASQVLSISCPYPRPRPMEWLYEESFRCEIERVRAVIKGGP